MGPCRNLGVSELASHRGSVAFIQSQNMRDLWWTEWSLGKFSPSTSVSPANFHSIIFVNHPIIDAIISILTASLNNKLKRKFQNPNKPMRTANKCYKNMAQMKYLGITVSTVLCTVYFAACVFLLMLLRSLVSFRASNRSTRHLRR
jgi:hypothetical protein